LVSISDSWSLIKLCNVIVIRIYRENYGMRSESHFHGMVSCPRRMRKLVNKPTFKHVTTYTETLAAVSLQKSDVHFSKPFYVEFAVLEISKELMYDYHYNVMRRYYNDSIRLMYMDTGIYDIINIVYTRICNVHNDFIQIPWCIK